MPYVHAEISFDDITDDQLLMEIGRRGLISDQLMKNTLVARNCPPELMRLIQQWMNGRLNLTDVLSLTK